MSTLIEAPRIASHESHGSSLCKARRRKTPTSVAGAWANTSRRNPLREEPHLARLAEYAGRILRRAIDILVSGSGLLLLAPLMLLVAACVRLESRGPALFFQPRVGKRGREFRMVKFRSMYLDAEDRRSEVIADARAQDEVRFKSKEDPRVTRVGRIIRRYSLDELPQLWNVLCGDMGLVGPRPPIPEETARYNLRQWRRLHIRPGLTCTWQVQGRADIPFARQVEMDIAYIENRSLWRDLRILAQTMPAVLSGRGAY